MDAEQVTPIVIAGGGLVGSLTAVLVGRSRPDVAIKIIERQPHGPVPDKRTIALAAATVRLLEQQQLWGELAAQAEPIRHIHVSDRGYLGTTRLHAKHEGVAALGYVVSAAALNRVLYAAIAAMPQIEWYGDSAVTELKQEQNYCILKVQGPEGIAQLRTQLLVGADGQRSFVREQLGIKMHSTDYDQVGVIANVQLSESLDGWAYERFTETGPVALLPLPEQQASLVWSVTEAEAAELMALPDGPFLTRLQQAFGYRAGRFSAVGERLQFPLQLHLAERSISHRAVIVGNASHTLHPIAGQGFNLGVRDAICLSEQLTRAIDPGAYRTLASYWQQRDGDYQRVIGLTDLLVRGFSNHYWPLNKARNLALLGLDAVAPLRHNFARQTMGWAPLASRGERS
ncbi:2-octaprenyl-6-methoxyphenyl hydroxylase [Pseudidiomarina insulisalsae]|uniref:2-octaprenyl-6-methoxyphenyl hydroxylase n=1 Tax=Pseudidiomarina insulisalsae TaxID=575789 RepID=A0A432YAP3_9GAMM|nr:2-octaprenyl-6-methoxyphenyl hydroxylase [Pseudidiomarina insulisalsae]RUO57936.1 2-octaprenyl-6-methoxyphenyl hydroxylase [Pseudidiomarina insulisalsae]